jgi:ribosomal protein L11 methyltransferase
VAGSSRTKEAPWRRAVVDCHHHVAETVSALLLDEGALGLETEDDETRAVPGKAAVLTGRSVITATFSREAGLEARVTGRLAQSCQYIPKAADLTIDWSDLFAEDWNAVFMSHWRPFRLGRRVWIVPSWERARFSAERVGPGPQPLILHLDPGMAFGTGQHETTQLCTEGLEQFLDQGQRIERLLDIGTGTGILALVALRLGARSCRGTDIDPVAVKAALDNAADNGVAAAFGADADAPDRDGPVYDAVVANILAGTLIELVDSVVGAVARGGRLWLSGILAEQAPAVVDVYVRAGMQHLATVTKGEWVRIDLVASGEPGRPAR